MRRFPAIAVVALVLAGSATSFAGDGPADKPAAPPLPEGARAALVELTDGQLIGLTYVRFQLIADKVYLVGRAAPFGNKPLEELLQNTRQIVSMAQVRRISFSDDLHFIDKVRTGLIASRLPGSARR